MATAAVQRQPPRGPVKMEVEDEEDDKMHIPLVATPVPQVHTIRFLDPPRQQAASPKKKVEERGNGTTLAVKSEEGVGDPPPTELEALIFHGLVDLVAREVSHEVHRQVRTGLLSMAEVFGTPGRAGARAGVFPPSITASCSSSSSSSCASDATTLALLPPAAPTALVVDDDSVDIYGRVPPKEPKYPFQCSACGRGVSVLRYAPHLDKCLGKNKMARNAGSQRKQSLGTSGSGPQVEGGSAGGALANGGDPAAALAAAADAIKKKKRKRNQNSHPELASYVFASDATGGPMLLRLRVGEDRKAVRVLPPTVGNSAVRVPTVSAGIIERDKGIVPVEAPRGGKQAPPRPHAQLAPIFPRPPPLPLAMQPGAMPLARPPAHPLPSVVLQPGPPQPPVPGRMASTLPGRGLVHGHQALPRPQPPGFPRPDGQVYAMGARPAFVQHNMQQYAYNQQQQPHGRPPSLQAAHILPMLPQQQPQSSTFATSLPPLAFPQCPINPPRAREAVQRNDRAHFIQD